MPKLAEKEPLRMDARSLEERIVLKYPQPAWVVLNEVRDGTGFDTRGIEADAIAFGVWPSRGLQIIGFEIKVHRNDWLRELKNPAKAEGIAKYCDQWFLVTCDGVVKPEEIPANWGWYVGTKSGLKLEKAPKDLEPKEIGRLFLMSIIRNISKTHTPNGKVNEVVESKLEEKVERRRSENSYRLEQLESLDKRVKEFEAASGISLWEDYKFPPKETGAIVKAVIGSYLKHEVDAVKRAAEKAKEVLEAITALSIYHEKA
jgi:hypothetical protein